MVVRRALGGGRPEANRFRLVVTEAGAGRDQVKHFHHLGPEAAGENGLTADGVLARHPPLFVGGRAKRKVRHPPVAGGA